MTCQRVFQERGGVNAEANCSVSTELEVVHARLAVVDGAHQFAEINSIEKLLIAKDRWRVLDAAVGRPFCHGRSKSFIAGPAIQAFRALVVLQKNVSVSSSGGCNSSSKQAWGSKALISC